MELPSFGKFVTSCQDRAEAIKRSRRPLAETNIEGIPTTIPFHQQVLDDERFQAADHSTAYVEDHLDIA
jgi:acetyl-CoA/propionyl-CoA carboxylase biotin carboxyl carrier protein